MLRKPPTTSVRSRAVIKTADHAVNACLSQGESIIKLAGEGCTVCGDRELITGRSVTSEDEANRRQ